MSTRNRSHQRARKDHFDSPAPRRMSEIESGARISTGSMITRHYADASITAPKYADASIGTTKYIDVSVTNAKLAANAGDARTQSDNSITSNFDAATGSTVRSHLGVDTVGQRELQSHTSNNALRSVGQHHVRDNAIQSRQLQGHATDDAQRAVTVEHIKDAAVTNAKIVGMLASKLTGTDAIPSSMIAGLAVSKLTGTLATAQYGDATVTNAKIAGMQGSKLTANSVTRTQIDLPDLYIALDARYAPK